MEIECSIKRLEIENRLFIFWFIINPSEIKFDRVKMREYIPNM